VAELLERQGDYGAAFRVRELANTR
jgi:hypothetical protein